MLVIATRVLILYLIVVLTIRLMGKHQIGQLQPYELVITILISELAAIPMQDVDIPFINGIIPIFTLLFIQIAFSLISLKSPGFRKLISGSPSILIRNGQINQSELSRLRYNLTDLLEQLRLKGNPNIADVEYAILETSGKLSVIPKVKKRAVSPEDLDLKPNDPGLPVVLVEDGIIKYDNLELAELNETELLKKLNQHGISNIKDAFLVSCDALGELYVQSKLYPPEEKPS